MKSRCTNKNIPAYKYYGGRDITICEKWMTYEGFSEDMLSEYKDGLTIDRVDNDRGYSKENCRWVTMEKQCNNKSNNRCIVIAGLTKTLAQWCKEWNVSYEMIRKRLIMGWSPLRAFTTPKNI